MDEKSNKDLKKEHMELVVSLSSHKLKYKDADNKINRCQSLSNKELDEINKTYHEELITCVKVATEINMIKSEIKRRNSLTNETSLTNLSKLTDGWKI